MGKIREGNFQIRRTCICFNFIAMTWLKNYFMKTIMKILIMQDFADKWLSG